MIQSLLAVTLDTTTLIPLSVVGTIVVCAIFADRRLSRVENALISIKELLEESWTISHQRLWTSEMKQKNPEINLPDPLSIKRNRDNRE